MEAPTDGGSKKAVARSGDVDVRLLGLPGNKTKATAAATAQSRIPFEASLFGPKQIKVNSAAISSAIKNVRKLRYPTVKPKVPASHNLTWCCLSRLEAMRLVNNKTDAPTRGAVPWRVRVLDRESEKIDA